MTGLHVEDVSKQEGAHNPEGRRARELWRRAGRERERPPWSRCVSGSESFKGSSFWDKALLSLDNSCRVRPHRIWKVGRL